MNCVICGATLALPHPETMPFTSLPGTLLVGVEVRDCSGCGEREVVIPRIKELMALLAAMVASRPGRLSGPEIRFLRKHIGWAGADFARLFGSSLPTVSRWEAGKQQMDIRAEMALRVSVTRLQPIDDYQEYEAFLSRVRDGQSSASPAREARWEGAHWSVNQAA